MKINKVTDMFTEFSRSIINVVLAAFYVFLSSTSLLAQGDACNNAQVINLSTPNGCTGPNGDGLGAPTNVGFSFTGITPANPYLSMLGCTGVGDMSSPANDGWYQFVATGTNVSLSFNDVEMNNLNVGIWSGNCGNLTALFCHNQAAPIANGFQLNFQPLVVGVTYYIQISGGTAQTDSDGFNFNITPNNNCDQCLTSASLTVDPLPINGTYVPGQIVDFCFTIEDWEQQETNWFHGIQINLAGSNWSNTFYTGAAPNGTSYTSAINPTINNTNDCGTGQFFYYPPGYTIGGGGVDNPSIVFPGFYYESNSGCAPCSGIDPSDNWGVSNAAGCNPLLQFCWRMRVGGSCPASSGASLDFTIGTTADGETGSWTSPACSGDNVFPFNGSIACCNPPVLSSTAVSCPSSTDGTVFVTNLNQTGSAPYTYFWYNSSGVQVGTGTVNTASVQSSTTVSGLPAGDYSILIQNSTGCLSGASVTIASAAVLSLNPISNVAVCAGEPVAVTFTSPQSLTYVQYTIDNPSIGLFNGTDNTSPFGLSFTSQNSGSTPIVATVTATPGNPSCLGSPSTFQITVNPAPLVTLSPPNTNICSGQSVNITGTYTPQPATTQITVANNNVTSIDVGTSSNTQADFTGLTVTTSGISPTTLVDGQLQSVCVTIRHECPSELSTNGTSREFYFFANGVWYTTTNPVTSSNIVDEVGAANMEYSSALATSFQVAINAAIASVTSPFDGCDNGNPITFTYCLPQSIIDILETNGTNSNGNWYFGVHDYANGAMTGNVTNTTIIINDYDSYIYDWTTNTTGLSNPVPSPYTGSTIGGPLTVTAAPTTNQTYTLEITDANGCTGSDDIAITVLPLPVVPTITPVTPICAGTNAVFNVAANAANANATITYNITSPTPLVNGQTYTLLADGSGSISIPTTLAQTQDVTIQLVSISNGSCSIPLSATYTVDVNPPTLPTFTQLGPYCQSTIPGALPSPSLNGINGTWSPATISTGTAGNAVYTFNPSSTAAPVCATSTTMTITINPTPVITPSATQVCLNQTVSWSGSGTAGSPAWSTTSAPPGNATFNNTSANPVTITGTQAGNVTIQYADANGCVVTNVLNVLPLPTVTSLVPVATPICFNTTAQWNVVGSPNSTVTYNVNGVPTGSVVTDGSGNTTISVTNATVNTTVALTNINNGSCSSALTNTSAIPVIPAPTMNDPSDISVCGGSPNTYDPEAFVLSPSGSGYAESFQWTSTAGIGLTANGTGQIGAISAPVNTTSDPIVGTVVITPYLGACAGTTQNFAVTINPTPVMSDPANLGVFCVGATVDPAAFVGNANAPVVTTYDWSNNNTGTGLGASGIDANIPSFTATNAGASALVSTVTVTASYTNNSVTCVGTPQQFTITVDPVPVVNNLNLTICETTPGVAVGQNLTANNGNIYAGATTYNWNYSVGGAVPDPANEDVTNGEVFDVQIVTANGCTNTATVTYIVTSGITVNSPTITICEDVLGGGEIVIADLATYNNNIFTGGTTYTWTASGGGAPALVPASTATPGGVTALNSYAYDVEVVQGLCPAVTGTITFVVDARVTAGTNGSIDLCSSDAAVNLFDELGLTPTLGGVWAGLSGLANGDQGTFDPSTNLGDTYTYDVLSGNSCPNDAATVAVTVTPAVYAGDGGPFQLCASAIAVESLMNYNVAGNGAITPLGTWTFISGPQNPGGSFNSAGGTIDPTGLPVGNYVFEYGVTAASIACPNDVAQVTMIIIGNIVLIDPLPILCETTAGSGQVLNYDLTQLNSGVFATGDSYVWTGGNTQTVSDGQIINVVVTQGTCINSISVTFTVEPLPLASTSGSGLTCENTVFTLPALAAQASNGDVLWTVQTGNGTITSGDLSLTPTYTPDPADAGSVVTLLMTVTSNNASCSGATATATFDIQVAPLPQATTIPLALVSICAVGGTYQLQAGEAVSANGTVFWTHNGNGGLIDPTSLTPTYTAVATDAGTTVTLTLTVTSNNACTGEEAIATYDIVVDAQPTATAGGSATICEGTSYTLVAAEANATNGSIIWTHDGMGGLTDETTLTPTYTSDPADAGTTVTLLMTVGNGGTCLDATAEYSVNINPLPLLTITDPDPACAPSAVDITFAEVTAGSDAGTITYWNDNPPTDQLTTLEAQSLGNGTYFIQLEALNCTSILPVNVVVNTQPVFTFDTLTPSACNLTDGNITLFGLNAGSDYDVSVFDGTDNTVTTMTTDASGELIIPNLGAGSYEVGVVLLSTNCGSDITSIEILNPGAPIITPLADVTVCDSYDLPTITGVNLSGNEAFYSNSQANGGTVITGPITSTQTVWIYDTLGICADQESFVVTIDLTPAIIDPGAQIECDTYALPAISGTNITGAADYYTNAPSLGGTVISGPVTSTQTVWIYDADGACADSLSFVVTINESPVLSITNPNDVCEPLTVDLTATAVTSGSTNATSLSYWTDPSGTTSLANPSSVSVSATYYIEADNAGCTDIAPVVATINPIPASPIAGNDSNYCSAWTLVPMTVQGTGGIYTWYYSNGSFISTGSTLTPNNTVGLTEYYVSETVAGCESPADIVVITIEDCEITVPTAFTPDADGVNDKWEIVDLDNVYTENVVMVFNRWGAKLYESDKGNYASKPWDGTFEGDGLPVGSYYFIIDFNLEDVEPMKGIVSIILE